MTPDELRAWRERMDYSNREAADALALSLSGFLKQLYGQNSVSPQTERLAALLEQKGKDA